MLYSQPLRYNNVIPANTVTNVTSVPVFTADFKEIQFTLDMSSTSNYNIFAIVSNQENPPDPTLPLSPTNKYSFVAYQDLDTEVTYTSVNAYNPGGTLGATTVKTFVVQANGARWFFLQLASRIAGTLIEADVDLFTAN